MRFLEEMHKILMAVVVFFTLKCSIRTEIAKMIQCV